MITEWLMSLAVWLGSAVLGMMPESEADSLVRNSSSIVADVAGMASGINVWFPWSVAAICGVSTFTMWGLLFVVKIVRQLLAHVPQFGGSG